MGLSSGSNSAHLKRYSKNLKEALERKYGEEIMSRNRETYWDIYFVPIISVILVWMLYTAWKVTEIAQLLSEF